MGHPDQRRGSFELHAPPCLYMCFMFALLIVGSCITAPSGRRCPQRRASLGAPGFHAAAVIELVERMVGHSCSRRDRSHSRRGRDVPVEALSVSRGDGQSRLLPRRVGRRATAPMAVDIIALN